ncbi:hypothetical protein QJQ45_003139 [Haematococcus lacustris]|nr:hypothetical protein QJQ45_003139 [Haematococcus lacustris]
MEFEEEVFPDISQHHSGVVPQIQNVVATVNLGCRLDLKEIALHARNAEYNPKRFAAVIMRIREPKTTALIFASGKMVCTGAKSEEDSRTAARKYAKIIQKLGFPATFKEFKIQNMVASCDVKFPIRLEGISCHNHSFSNVSITVGLLVDEAGYTAAALYAIEAQYEPELFPGLIYRMKVPKVVLLIFVSGKVVLTGAKKREDIYNAFMKIYPILTVFKKGGSETATALLGPAGEQQQLLEAGPGQHPGAAGPSGMQQQMLQQRGPQAGNQSPNRLPPPTPMHHTHGNMPSHGGMDLPPPTPMHDSMM